MYSLMYFALTHPDGGVYSTNRWETSFDPILSGLTASNTAFGSMDGSVMSLSMSSVTGW